MKMTHKSTVDFHKGNTNDIDDQFVIRAKGKFKVKSFLIN